MAKLIALTLIVGAAVTQLCLMPVQVQATRAEEAAVVAHEAVDHAWCEVGSAHALASLIDPDRAKAAWAWAATDIEQAQMRAADVRYDVRL